jgi:hypothetical protein
MPKKNRDKIDVFVMDVVTGGGGSDTTSLGPIIPTGERWRITKLGCGDVANGDGVAAVLELQVRRGSPTPTFQPVQAIAVVGNTVEIRDVIEVKGDGTRRLRLVRTNHSAAAKQIIAWCEGYKVPAT